MCVFCHRSPLMALAAQMKPSPPASSRLLRVLLAVLVLAGVLYLLPNRFISASKDQAEVDIKKLVAEWGDCAFEKPTVEAMLKVLDATNTVVSGGGQLSTEQKTAYAAHLEGMFDSFSSGDYGRYRTWRFAAAVEPRQDFIDEVRTTIVKGYRIAPNAVYVRDKDVAAKARSLLVAEAPTEPERVFEQFVRLQSLGEFYKGFWKGFCTKNMQVRFDYMTSPPNQVEEYQFSFLDNTGAHPHTVKAGIENIGLAAHPGFFNFKESPGEVLKKQGNILVAHVMIMVDMGDGRGAGPIVAQAYWAPSAHRWLPSGMAEGNLWKIHGVQLCF